MNTLQEDLDKLYQEWRDRSKNGLPTDRSDIHVFKCRKRAIELSWEKRQKLFKNE